MAGTRQHGVWWLLAPVTFWTVLAAAVLALMVDFQHSWEPFLRAFIAVAIAVTVVAGRVWSR
jgi:hypothetical protein